MNVLMHYTTHHHVFNLFSRTGTNSFTNKERIKSVSDFYNRFHRSQNHLFFVVSYFDSDSATTNYTVSSINFDESSSEFKYSTVSESTKK